MKKFTFALMALLAFTFTLKAQQYVSTEPANRNVVIEEFTGRNCGYCPIGHRITHELMEEHPGRVFAINVHCTSLSPTTYPNLNITKGNSIANGFSFSGIPMGMVNRHSGSAAETSQFVPVDECVKFTIYDQVGNGICCNNGQGYYIVKDSHGNVIFGNENDGEFGESASHLISVRNHQTTVEVGGTEAVNVDYTHADFVSSLVYEVYPDQVGFECRKVTSSEPMIIPGILNEFQKILGTTDELEHSTIYVVRAFAVVNGETYYGAETTFQTWTEGVDEFGESVKIYPNPTSGVLNIQGEGLKSIEVYNTKGQCVMMQEVNGDGIQLNTESLNNGIYFLRVRANDGTLLNRTFSVAR